MFWRLLFCVGDLGLKLYHTRPERLNNLPLVCILLWSRWLQGFYGADSPWVRPGGISFMSERCRLVVGWVSYSWRQWSDADNGYMAIHASASIRSIDSHYRRAGQSVYDAPISAPLAINAIRYQSVRDTRAANAKYDGRFYYELLFSFCLVLENYIHVTRTSVKLSRVQPCRCHGRCRVFFYARQQELL